MPPRPSLEHCPPEVLDQIILQLDSKSCKKLRLTSRSLAAAAAPHLYTELILFPHRQSFKKLQTISSNPRFGHFVKVLVYRTQCVALTDELLKHLEHYLQDEPDELRERVRTEFSNIDKHALRADSSMDCMLQAELLAACFPPLVNLTSIIIGDPRGHEQRGVSGVPRFYGQMWTKAWYRCLPMAKLLDALATADFDLDPHGDYASILIFAIRHLPNLLEQLSLQGLSWKTLLAKQLTRHGKILAHCFGSLKRLKMSSNDSRFEIGPESANLVPLQTILGRALQLEELSLAFAAAPAWEAYIEGDTFFYQETEDWIESMFGDCRAPPTQPRLTWSTNLHALKLAGLRCTTSELLSVLSHCSKSLRHLTLWDLLLFPNRPYKRTVKKAPRACLVALFREISSLLRLESAQLAYGFSNGGLQGWTLRPPYQRESIHGTPDMATKLEQYLMRRGPSPVEDFAIPVGWFDIGRRSYKVRPDGSSFEDARYKGDPSFNTNYSSDWIGLRTSDEDEAYE